MIQLITLALVASASVHGYEYVTNMNVDWENAKVQCMSQFGLPLAKVDTQAHLYEIAAVTQTWEPLQHVWIGAKKDAGNTANFYWTDGSPVTELFFKPGEPNSGVSELCVHMWHYLPAADLANKQVWNDAQCSSSGSFKAACGFGTWTTVPPTAAPTTTATPTTTPSPTTTAAPTTAPSTAAPSTAAPSTAAATAAATTAAATTAPGPATTTAAIAATTSAPATTESPVTTSPAAVPATTAAAPTDEPFAGLLLAEGAGVNFGMDGLVKLRRSGDSLEVDGKMSIDGMDVAATLVALLAEVQQLRADVDALTP